MTALLAAVAPLALLLEGGYNLSATAAGTESSLRVLLGERPPPLADAGAVNSLAATAIREVVRIQVRDPAVHRSIQSHCTVCGTALIHYILFDSVEFSISGTVLKREEAFKREDVCAF
jgi:hypothetical protein